MTSEPDVVLEDDEDGDGIGSENDDDGLDDPDDEDAFDKLDDYAREELLENTQEVCEVITKVRPLFFNLH